MISNRPGSIDNSVNMASMSLRAVPEIILRGWVGRRHFFVLWGGGGCFVAVSEGWGGVTRPGGQGISDP